MLYQYGNFGALETEVVLTTDDGMPVACALFRSRRTGAPIEDWGA